MNKVSSNVGDVERLASTVAGAFLAWKGLRRGHLLGKALLGTGGALLWRGVSGHCAVYQTLGVSTAHQLSLPRQFTVRKTIAVSAQPKDLIRRAKGDIGRVVGSNDEITIDGETADGFAFSLGKHHGHVRVEQEPYGNMSLLEVTIDADTGDGLFGKGVALAGKAFVEHYLYEAMRKFKMYVECGEVATTAGQTHGVRGKAGQALLGLIHQMENRTGGRTPPRLSAPPRVEPGFAGEVTP